MEATIVTSEPRRIPAAQIILVVFMGTVTMLFAGFTAAYMIRRAGSDWTHIPLPGVVWINTAILIVSSVTIEFAWRRRSQRWTALSLILGAVFLLGQIMAWRQLTSAGLGLGANAHGSFFYMLSAVHGLHLVGGVCAMIYALRKGSASRLIATYWHFMGGVWLYVLLLLAV